MSYAPNFPGLFRRPTTLTNSARGEAGGIATTAQLLEWAYPRGPGRDRRQRKARAIAVSHAAVTAVA